jgi:hypothetical protein
MRRLVLLALAVPSLLGAQTPRDSVFARKAASIAAATDTIDRRVATQLARYCRTTKPALYLCSTQTTLTRLLARSGTDAATIQALALPAPVPPPVDTTPTPVPVPPVDTTTPAPPPTGTVGPATVAELPRNVVAQVRPTVTRAVKVCATCSLQAAMNNAVSGDELLLVPGAVYPGNFVWPNKGAAYGHPIDDYTRTGRMWGAILGVPDIDPRICCLMMSAVKISREVNAPKRDNRVDLAGYAECAEMVAQRQAERP